MNGMKHLFMRILPIITLICFISFGILQLFPNNQNITYLSQEYYDKETGEKYINPTEQQKQNSNELYTFDLIEYTNNIDQDILKRSVSKTFNFSAYQNLLSTYETIWQDGYNFGDGIKTIINTIVLVINSFIFPINILFIPIRVIAGILLTGMSLLGININNGLIITPFLTLIVDNLSIPLIQGLYNKTETDTLPYSVWYLKDIPERKYQSKFTTVVAGQLNTTYTDFDIDIGLHTDERFGNGTIVGRDGIRTTYTVENNEFVFRIYLKGGRGVYETLIYENGYLENTTDKRTLYFEGWIADEDANELRELMLFLESNANFIRNTTPPENTENSTVYYNDNKKYIFA